MQTETLYTVKILRQDGTEAYLPETLPFGAGVYTARTTWRIASDCPHLIVLVAPVEA